MSILNVDIPDSILRPAQTLAKDGKVGIDQLIAPAVAEKVAALNAEMLFGERAARGSRAKYEAVLGKVPNVGPEEGDQRWSSN